MSFIKQKLIAELKYVLMYLQFYTYERLKQLMSSSLQSNGQKEILQTVRVFTTLYIYNLSIFILYPRYVMQANMYLFINIGLCSQILVVLFTYLGTAIPLSSMSSLCTNYNIFTSSILCTKYKLFWTCILIVPALQLICGGLSGSTAALFTTPFDVVKTRLQTQVAIYIILMFSCFRHTMELFVG